MKNIIFDWSGVVKDALKSQVWIANKILIKYGVEEMSLDEFQNNWIQPYMLFYDKYLPTKITPEQQSEEYRKFMFHPDCPKACAYAGMTDLIKKLKTKGVFMAVVSSDLKETLLREIKDYGLDGIFQEVITDVHDKFIGAKKILEDYNLDPENTFFIGDSNHEIEVAKKLGIHSVATTWGFMSKKQAEINTPDYIVNDVNELEQILDVK